MSDAVVMTISVRDVPEVQAALALAEELARAGRAVVEAWEVRRGFGLGERIAELKAVVEIAERTDRDVEGEP
jgi:hypothetical protein